MKLERYLRVITLILVLGHLACSPSKTNQPVDTVTVQLKWTHQAQFAGLYVACDKGYYADENIEIRFLEGGQKIDLTQSLISGKADFAVLAPEDVLIRRSRGAMLTAIAAIYRRSAVMYTAMADSGIVRPSDFIGKTVAAKGIRGAVRDMELQFSAMMKRLKLDLSQVTLVPYDPSYQDFLNGKVDVTAAYLTGGVMKMRSKGIKLNLVWPGDYGVDFYSDIIATLETTIAQKPDLVERFLRATLKGWDEAIGNSEMAVTTTLKYTPIKKYDLQCAMLESLIPLVHTGRDHIGWMHGADWKAMYDILFDQGMLVARFDPDAAFTMSFLQKIYGGLTP